MKSSFPAASVLMFCACAMLYACASSQPDHFYILSAEPSGASEPRAASATQVTLKVTLPSLVDRPEMVVNTTSEGVSVLEHERWGAPLIDLMTQTLARDIERRRPDVWIAGPGTRLIGDGLKITVDVVQVTLRRGDRASIDTHWRIIDLRSGNSQVGGATLSAPLGEDGYAGVAQALSECLGELADRLVAQM